jgi:hypothetical protein
MNVVQLIDGQLTKRSAIKAVASIRVAAVMEPGIHVHLEDLHLVNVERIAKQRML